MSWIEYDRGSFWFAFPFHTWLHLEFHWFYFHMCFGKSDDYDITWMRSLSFPNWR
jgi:hypothetical protein